MMFRYRLIANSLLPLLLIACGTSTPVHYYGLDALETEFKEDTKDAPGFGIGPLRFPDYMSRSQILTRGEDAEFRFDDFNRWAEPLEDAIYRVVTANLDGILDNVVVVSFPYNHLAALSHQLVGRVDRLVAGPDGDVTLEVQWAIITSGGDFLVAARRAHYEKRAADPGDYNDIAAAMSEVLADFSRDVAREYDAARAGKTN
jgi:uncharacterized lipoprotein YmbA